MELGSLLDLAIGKPDAGAVNFKVLHSFLQNLLGHFAVTNVEVEVSIDKSDGNEGGGVPMKSVKFADGTNESKPKDIPSIFHAGGAVEKRVHELESKMNLLDSFAETDDILNWAREREQSRTRVGDMWNFMNFQKRIEASENGIKKVSNLVDKILAQLQNVTDLQDRMYKVEKKLNELDSLKKEVNRLSDKVNILADSKRVDQIMDELNRVKESLVQFPVKEDLLTYVKWPDLQLALETGKIGKDHGTSERQSEPGSMLAGKLKHGATDSDKHHPLHPSPLVLHKLGELGGLSQAHWILKEDVDDIKQQLKTKANKADLEGLASGEIPEDLIQQLEDLHNGLDDLKLWQKDVDLDRSSIAGLKEAIDDMKKNVERLQTKMKFVVEEHTRKQEHIDALYIKTEDLERVKANKEDVDAELANKADKTDLENYVNRQRFETDITRIDDALKELIDQVKSSDDNLNKMISKILNNLEMKLDRDEFIDFKEKIENRLKALKMKAKEEPTFEEDPAAAFKKAMLQFNCLSCDRPVYFSGNGPIQGYSGFSATKSGRTYTTYDLEQLRLLQKANLKPDSTEFSMPRSCGGAHTSGIQPRRITAKLMSEVELQGQDGKLYKGRIEKSEELSHKMGRVKPKSAHGYRTSIRPPGEGNSTPRRPKTAVTISPTMDLVERQQYYRSSFDANSDPDDDVGDENISI